MRRSLASDWSVLLPFRSWTVTSTIRSAGNVRAAAVTWGASRYAGWYSPAHWMTGLVAAIWSRRAKLLPPPKTTYALFGM